MAIKVVSASISDQCCIRLLTEIKANTPVKHRTYHRIAAAKLSFS